MSSPTSRADHDDSGFDRRNLADGKVNADGEGTNMLPTTMRTY